MWARPISVRVLVLNGPPDRALWRAESVRVKGQLKRVFKATTIGAKRMAAEAERTTRSLDSRVSLSREH